MSRFDETSDQHYPCKEQLKRLNAEWADRYYMSNRVKSVIRETDDGSGKVMHVLQVLDVVNEDDGVTVIVR